MKIFIIKISIFLAILLCYLGVNGLVNYYFISTNKSIPIADKRILIIGASTTQKGLNPKYFSSAQNISQPGDSYIVMFWKLKRIFNTYRPDTLIVGFGPTDITIFNDYKFSTDRWSAEMFKRSYLIENFSEIENRIKVDYFAYYKTLIKETALYPQRNHHVKYIGEYSNTTASNILNRKSKNSKTDLQKKLKLGYSNVSISYLDSIKNLCDSKRITLVLVSCPIHKSMNENKPEPLGSKHSELLENYKKKYLVIDRTNEIYPDSLFLDFSHLNELGATRFTKTVIDELHKARSCSNRFYGKESESDNFSSALEN